MYAPRFNPMTPNFTNTDFRQSLTPQFPALMQKPNRLCCWLLCAHIHFIRNVAQVLCIKNLGKSGPHQIDCTTFFTSDAFLLSSVRPTFSFRKCFAVHIECYQHILEVLNCLHTGLPIHFSRFLAVCMECYEHILGLFSCLYGMLPTYLLRFWAVRMECYEHLFEAF